MKRDCGSAYCLAANEHLVDVGDCILLIFWCNQALMKFHATSSVNARESTMKIVLLNLEPALMTHRGGFLNEIGIPSKRNEFSCESRRKTEKTDESSMSCSDVNNRNFFKRISRALCAFLETFSQALNS